MALAFRAALAVMDRKGNAAFVLADLLSAAGAGASLRDTYGRGAKGVELSAGRA